MAAVTLLLLILLGVFCATSSNASTPGVSHSLHRTGLLGYRFQEHSNREESEVARAQVPEKWFDQKLDHFDAPDTRRWKQRYFITGPSKSNYLFVRLGGEGGTNPNSCISYAMAGYAKTYNATCAVLEHRYYGKSHPTPDLSTMNLQYLSSEQALADTAAFITAIKEEVSAEKVIVFGGSYSGNLAAWFRMKYPHLAWAAVASSAPILAKVNFQGFIEVQAEPLYTYKTGHVCATAVSDAWAQMNSLMETVEGKAKLRKLFNVCEDMDFVDKKNLTLFYDEISNLVLMQNMTKNCDVMTNTSLGEPLERYAKLQEYPDGCRRYNYNGDDLTFYQNTTWGDNWNDQARQWEYQTCTEFGYYRTTDSDKQPFGGLSIEFHTQLCTDIYGPEFTAETIARAVRDTNINYGGLDYALDRIVFVNGGRDPWHRLSITHSLPNAPAIFIPNGHHCEDMPGPAPEDSPALVKARNETLKLIGQWLE